MDTSISISTVLFQFQVYFIRQGAQPYSRR